MSPVKRFSDEQLEAGNRQYGNQFRDKEAVQAPPELRNFASMYNLGGDAYLEWRGMYMVVPPIPFREGAKLHEMRVRLTQLEHERKRDEKLPDSEEKDRREGMRLMEERMIREEMVTTFKKCVKPRRWWQALAWKVLPNPFRQASEQEMVELLSFFLLCRTKSRLRPAYSPSTENGETASRR